MSCVTFWVVLRFMVFNSRLSEHCVCSIFIGAWMRIYNTKIYITGRMCCKTGVNKIWYHNIGNGSIAHFDILFDISATKDTMQIILIV
jgi:hypothetical protein